MKKLLVALALVLAFPVGAQASVATYSGTVKGGDYLVVPVTLPGGITTVTAAVSPQKRTEAFVLYVADPSGNNTSCMDNRSVTNDGPGTLMCTADLPAGDYLLELGVYRGGGSHSVVLTVETP